MKKIFVQMVIGMSLLGSVAAYAAPGRGNKGASGNNSMPTLVSMEKASGSRS